MKLKKLSSEKSLSKQVKVNKPARTSIEHFLTKAELAEYLRVSISMIDKLMSTGLPYQKIGRSVRFELSEVRAYLERIR